MEKRPPPSPLVSSPYSKRAEIRDRWVAFCPSLPRASFSLANIIRVQRTKERPGPRNRAMWLPFGGIFFFFLSLERRISRCFVDTILSVSWKDLEFENSSAKDFEDEESREMKENWWKKWDERWNERKETGSVELIRKLSWEFSEFPGFGCV